MKIATMKSKRALLLFSALTCLTTAALFVLAAEFERIDQQHARDTAACLAKYGAKYCISE